MPTTIIKFKIERNKFSLKAAYSLQNRIRFKENSGDQVDKIIGWLYLSKSIH